jgi:hypothetical protein
MAIEIVPPRDDHPYGEVRYTGHVTDAQVAESIMQMLGIASELDLWTVLTDCREMVWTPSLAEVQAAVTGLVSLVSPTYREALVLPSDVSARVSATHYITVASNRGMQVQGFSTREDALAWLLD